ncbi:molecular chaperone DnaK (HSP70) [Evansella vedderi]|uniref:Molecular chaperone DnaK (HSP70) n=1 Tax=Evansella vedderi TaxID=38282 RepID=A0ABT9ZWY5_9BACI|nr:hypothetical protein [Evansella vedderi]MDQ0255470.1 molecular chaperone DnaK (HSP70) [Evansella vedderi]
MLTKEITSSFMRFIKLSSVYVKLDGEDAEIILDEIKVIAEEVKPYLSKLPEETKQKYRNILDLLQKSYKTEQVPDKDEYTNLLSQELSELEKLVERKGD